MAKVTLASNVAGADVSVDGNVIGKTPLAAPIVLNAGRHELAVRLAPYTSENGEIAVPGRTFVAVAEA